MEAPHFVRAARALAFVAPLAAITAADTGALAQPGPPLARGCPDVAPARLAPCARANESRRCVYPNEGVECRCLTHPLYQSEPGPRGRPRWRCASLVVEGPLPPPDLPA